MTEEQVPERVLAQFTKWGFTAGCEIVGNWKGYVVWGPLADPDLGVPCGGPPYFVLDDGERARGTSPKEGSELLDHFQTKSHERVAQDKQPPERVMALFAKGCYPGCAIAAHWNGYVVWGPLPDPALGVPAGFAPYYVLDDGEHARWTNPKERFELSDYFYWKNHEGPTPEEQVPERVLAEFRKLGLKPCRLVGHWKDYDVWSLAAKSPGEVLCIGRPFFVLDDGEHVRVTGCASDEVREIIRYFDEKEE